MTPEFRCPACYSHDVRIYMEGVLTYDQNPEGAKRLLETVHEKVQLLQCNVCEYESDGDDCEEWKTD